MIRDTEHRIQKDFIYKRSKLVIMIIMQIKKSFRLLIFTFIITVTLSLFEHQFHNRSLAMTGCFNFYGFIYGFCILCPVWLTIKNLQYNKQHQILV
jgi:hypothetical protein